MRSRVGQWASRRSPRRSGWCPSCTTTWASSITNRARILRARFVIEEAQVVVHEGHQPDLLGDLLDAHCPTRERMTQVDLASAQADSTAARHRDRAIVEGIADLG